VLRFALLLPLWLVFAVGEPSLVHSCPTHGGAAGAGVAVAEHSGHGEAHAPHHASHSHGGAPQGKHYCTCIGCCTIAGGAVLPHTSVVSIGAVIVGQSALPNAPSRVSHRDAHLLLPYANGPPA
jgi:hypothetical protein